MYENLSLLEYEDNINEFKTNYNLKLDFSQMN